MTRTLCIDTSIGTAVALVDGEQVDQRYHPDARAHAETLAPLIAQLCPTPAPVVVVSTGPAPYTGLRVGIATARVYAAATGAKLYGVSVLDAYARSYFDTHRDAQEVTVVSDARRKEVYWACFTPLGSDDVTCTRGPGVCQPAALQVSGALAGHVHLVDREREDTTLSMAAFARIAAARAARGEAQGTAPLYLREPDIHRK